MFETLSSIDASLAVMVGVHCGLGSKAIVLHGNDEQKERYLPPLARGDFLAAYALTEPEVGSDAQNIKTTATLSQGWLALASQRPEDLDRQRPPRRCDRDVRAGVRRSGAARPSSE